MEGEPLCRSSAAVKAEREEYALEASAPQNKPSFHSSRCFIIGASLARKKKKKMTGERRSEHNLIRFGIKKKKKKQPTNEMLEFKMSTRSLGIIETIQLYLMCKNNNKSACDRLFPGNGIKKSTSTNNIICVFAFSTSVNWIDSWQQIELLQP